MLLVLFSCAPIPDSKAPEDTGASSPLLDCADSGVDSDVDSAPDSEPGSTTESGVDPAVYVTGLTELSREPGDYGELGYVVSTFEVGADYARHAFLTPDGSLPRFRVIWPEDGVVTGPLALHLHGGSADADSDEDPDGESNRCTGLYGSEQVDSTIANMGLAYLIAHLRGVLIVPENAFCDNWVGEASADPVDPEHGGYALAETAVEFVRYGCPELGLSDAPVVVSGSSLGGMGAADFVSNFPDVMGLISDSSPPNVARYVQEEDYSPYDLGVLQRRYEHLLGGPPFDEAGQPTDAYPGYVDLSLELSPERFTVPVFHLYNQRDLASPFIQHEGTDAILAASGIRWMSYDVDHDAPPHGQLASAGALYASWSALQFIAGQEILVVECEEQGGTTEVSSAASKGEVARLSGAGTLCATTIDVPAGARLTAFLSGENVGSVTLSLGSDETNVDGAVLGYANGTSGSVDAMLAAQVTTTTDGPQPFEIRSDGGTLRADVVVVDW